MEITWEIFSVCFFVSKRNVSENRHLKGRQMRRSVRGYSRGYYGDKIVLVGKCKYMQKALPDESQVTEFDGAKW